jgi:hypothetical protein
MTRKQAQRRAYEHRFIAKHGMSRAAYRTLAPHECDAKNCRQPAWQYSTGTFDSRCFFHCTLRPGRF